MSRTVSSAFPPNLVQALLAAIIDSADDAVVSKDLDGVVTSWNPSAERIFGYSAAEMIGQSILRLIPPERPDEEPEILARLRRGERVDHFETVRVRKDGRRIDVSVTISPIRDASGRVVGASKIARDITEQKRMEAELAVNAEQLQLYGEQVHAQNEELQMQNEELAAQNEELAEADRQKDRFLAMLAHELRNPLGPVLNAILLLRQRLPEDSEEQRYAGVIDRQIQHMRRLLDDLLDVSRVKQGLIQLRRENVDLGLLLYSVVQDLSDFAEERKQKLNIVVPPGPLEVEGDPVRLEQVVTNLLNNAIKFTPPEGSIELSAEEEGGDAVIRVRDSGIGIPGAMLPRVFELFTQGDQGLARSKGGLGVGLTMVRNLVTLHEGTVEAHSPGEGKGAEFVVRLPLRRVKARSALAEAPARGRSGTAGDTRYRVLIVDDVRDAADTLGELLESWGHRVRVAYSAAAALAAAGEFQPEVAILDIGMPKMDGYELAGRLKEARGQDVILIALSGYGQEGDRRAAGDAGFSHHFTKPVDPLALRDLLAR